MVCHSNETSSALLSHGTKYYVVKISSIIWIFGWNKSLLDWNEAKRRNYAVHPPVSSPGTLSILVTFLICSTNSFLSPVYFVLDGPLSWLLALTRSAWSDERQRANTDSPEKSKFQELAWCFLWGCLRGRTLQAELGIEFLNCQNCRPT